MNTRFIVLAILMIVILAPATLALGISPTRNIIDFNPSQTITGKITLLNSNHKDTTILMTVSGDIAKYIKSNESLITLKASENSKDFIYQINLPSSFDKPGFHDAEIIATEIPSNANQPGASIGTMVSVSMQVRVRVPYPGKYAETRLDVSEANVNESVMFVLPVTNLGSQDIAQAVGTINILGPTNENLGTVNTLKKPVPAQKTEEFVSSWVAEVNPGIYLADAAITYDGKIATAQRSFAVGNLFVDLLRADVKDFKLGGIAQISLSIENKWNQNLPDVYAELFVYDDKGAQIYTTKSTSVSLNGFEKKVLQIYWDTQGLVTGVYRSKIILHYSSKSTERPLRLVVGQASMDAQMVSATGQVISTEIGASGKSSPFNLFLIIQILFIGVNIGVFFYFKRKFDANKKT